VYSCPLLFLKLSYDCFAVVRLQYPWSRPLAECKQLLKNDVLPLQNLIQFRETTPSDRPAFSAVDQAARDFEQYLLLGFIKPLAGDRDISTSDNCLTTDTPRVLSNQSLLLLPVGHAGHSHNCQAESNRHFAPLSLALSPCFSPPITTSPPDTTAGYSFRRSSA